MTLNKNRIDLQREPVGEARQGFYAEARMMHDALQPPEIIITSLV